MTVQFELRQGARPLLIAVALGLSSLGMSAGIQNVVVVGTDYAFGVPATVTHGLTAFSFENRGKVRHEMSLFWLKQGVTLDSVLRTEPGPTRRRLVEGGGVLFAEPGDRSAYRLLADLAAGRTYLLICNFRDAPDKPQHTELGMFATFQVK